MMNKKPLKIPEYFKDLPNNALLNYKEIAEIFGLNRMNLTHYQRSGEIPLFDVRQEFLNWRGIKTTRLFWKVKTIREWIKNANNNRK